MKNILVATITVFWTLATQLTFTLRPGYADSPNGMCLTESEFTDFNTMDLAAIRNWLNNCPKCATGGGFLRGGTEITPYTFTDIDLQPTDPAKEIFDAAQLNKINPRVLLTLLRKESSKVFNSTARPTDRRLSKLAGCGVSPSAREQIRCMGRKLKEYFYDQLSQCQSTIGGWNVDPDPPKRTGDTGNETTASGAPCSVVPESKTVAAMFQYNPWKGTGYDGCGYGDPLYLDGVPGNWAFCWLWRRLHGWEVTSPPLALSQQNPTMNCAPPTPQQPSRCISINASGGDTSGGFYSWGNTGGVITISGVNQQNIQLKPPVSKDIPGVVAYRSLFQAAESCPFGTQGTIGYELGCQDQQLQCGAQFTAPPCLGFTVCDVSIGCSCQDLTCLPCGSRCDKVMPSGGRIVDCRDPKDPTMIDCKPCRVVMQGVTVTVTDSAGATATTTVGTR